MAQPLAPLAPLGAPIYGSFGLMTPDQLALIKQQEDQVHLDNLMQHQPSVLAGAGAGLGAQLGGAIQQAVNAHYGRVDPEDAQAQQNQQVLQAIQTMSGGDPDKALQIAAQMGIPQAVQALQQRQQAAATLAKTNKDVSNIDADNARADAAAALAKSTADRETKQNTYTTIKETPAYIVQQNGLGQIKIERKESTADAQAAAVSPDDKAAYVQSIANYTQPMPTASARGLKAIGMTLPELTGLVQQVNPDWSATGYPGMLAFTSKPQGAQLRAQDAATRHIGLYDQASKLYDTGNLVALNRLAAAAGVATGDSAVTTLRNIASVVGPEVTKAIVPGGGGQAEREINTSKLDPALSPAQRTAATSTFRDLMAQQRAATFDQLQSAAPGYSQEAFDKRFPVSASFRAYLDSQKPGATPAAPAAAAVQTATGPNGQKLKLVNGQWVPM